MVTSFLEPLYTNIPTIVNSKKLYCKAIFQPMNSIMNFKACLIVCYIASILENLGNDLHFVSIICIVCIVQSYIINPEKCPT